MKRGLIILTFFAILIGISLAEDISLRNKLDELNARANNLLELAQITENVDNENITNYINDLEEFWTKTESWFCLVVNHINIEEVGEQIAKITALSSLNKKDEIIVEIQLLIHYSVSYQHLIIPHIQNIL